MLGHSGGSKNVFQPSFFVERKVWSPEYDVSNNIHSSTVLQYNSEVLVLHFLRLKLINLQIA